MSDLASAIRGRTVAIVGGTGLIGGTIAAQALGHGASAVYAVARNLVAPRLGVTYVKGSILDAALALPRVDLAVFVAGPASNYLDDPWTTIEVSTSGVSRFLDLTKGARRVVVGSARVYGRRADTTPLRESDPAVLASPARTNFYDAAKLLTEALALHASTSDAPVTIARIGNVFGPSSHGRKDTVFASFVEGARMRRSILVKDPHSLRNHLSSGEVADGILRTLAFGRGGEAYNIGSAAHLTNHAFATKIAALVGADVVVEVPSPAPTGEHMVLSLEKATRELGVSPSSDIDEALAGAVASELEDRAT